MSYYEQKVSLLINLNVVCALVQPRSGQRINAILDDGKKASATVNAWRLHGAEVTFTSPESHLVSSVILQL